MFSIYLFPIYKSYSRVDSEFSPTFTHQSKSRSSILHSFYRIGECLVQPVFYALDPIQYLVMLIHKYFPSEPRTTHPFSGYLLGVVIKLNRHDVRGSPSRATFVEVWYGRNGPAFHFLPRVSTR